MKKVIFLLLLLALVSCTQKKEKEIEVEEIDPFIYKTGSLKSGETLAKALIKKNIDNAVVYKMVNKLDSIYDLRKSHPADSFIVKLDSLDIIHELVHVRQQREGLDLYDRSKAYVDRETEIEAYEYTINEARRIGLSEEEILDYLTVEWITLEEYRRLADRLGVGSGSNIDS